MIEITEFDLIFISFDEPNADENWFDLKNKCPWAKRSHGVYGSDAAHKAAAKLSETDRLITVDADNKVYDEFFNISMNMNQIGKDDVISWAGKNIINGLVYGNGGIKCWPKHIIENMKTHELAPKHNRNSQVDFCWNVNYLQMNNVFSDVYNNASPYQAYRAGFREGCKMSLEGGNVIDPKFIKNMHRMNYKRLLTWMSVGADALNGLWSMYGARHGCEMINLRRDEWDWINVRDFHWHTKYWEEKIAPFFEDKEGEICVYTGYTYNKDKLKEEIKKLGQILKDKMDLEVADLDEDSSKFFKAVYINPPRIHPLTREEDVLKEVEDIKNN